MNTHIKPGQSNHVRQMLVAQLGYGDDIAQTAVIEWRGLDNGSYGWIVQLPNGTAHIFDIDSNQFVRNVNPVTLSPAQVKELLRQIDLFADIVNSAFDDGDLDRAENASIYAIELGKVLNK